MNNAQKALIACSGESFHSTVYLMQIGGELQKKQYDITFVSGKRNLSLIRDAGFKVRETMDLPEGLDSALDCSYAFLKDHVHDFFSHKSDSTFMLEEMLKTDISIYKELSPDILISDARFLLPQIGEQIRCPAVWMYSQWGNAFINFAAYLEKNEYKEISSEMFLDFSREQENHPEVNFSKKPILTLIPNKNEFEDEEIVKSKVKGSHIHFTGPIPDPFLPEKTVVRDDRKTVLLGLDNAYPSGSLYNSILQLAGEYGFRLLLYLGKNTYPDSGVNREQLKQIESIQFDELISTLDRCDLLITSGSPQLCTYAVSREVPCLVIPFNSVQEKMAWKIRDRKLGDFFTLSANGRMHGELGEIVGRLLSDAEYKANVANYKKSLSRKRDPLQSTVEVIRQKEKNRVRQIMASVFLSDIKQEKYIEQKKKLIADDLKEITIIPTLKCQNRCEYCLQDQAIETHKARKDRKYFQEVTVDKWIALIQAIQEATSLVISGGEPTLYKGIDDILYAGVENEFVRTTLITNLFGTVEFYRKILDWGVMIIMSLHQGISQRDEDEILHKVALLKNPAFKLRILTDFRDRERVERLTGFMHAHGQPYYLGIIYTVQEDRYAVIADKYFPAYNKDEIAQFTDQSLKERLRSSRSEVVPGWANDIIYRSKGLGEIDFQAISNFILFPSYYSARNTSTAKCRVPAEHLTIYPNGSVWTCNIYMNNVFETGLSGIAGEIVCPDYGHCLETCRIPPFADEV